jgi:predicted MPP superfamily phosphohydrolase
MCVFSFPKRSSRAGIVRGVHRDQHRASKTNFIVKSVGPISEWAIDKIFLSSIVVAPAAVIGTIYFVVTGNIHLALLCALIAPLAGLGIYARYVAPWQIRVRRLSTADLGAFIPLRAALYPPPPLRVVFFSDLHLGRFKRTAWTQKVVDLVNAQLPDVVLIGGDFVGITDCCTLPDLLAPLAQLRAQYGVYAVLGNHDHGLPGPDLSQDLAQLFPQLNVRLLCNECIHIREDVQLVGVEELWAHRDDLPKAVASCNATSGRLLVLGHNPDLMLRVEHEYTDLDTQSAFFLFGHTHQGQIYLPFAPGLAIPIKSKYYRGVYHKPFGSFYVSSGLGESATPTRLNTWPEIVVLDI